MPIVRRADHPTFEMAGNTVTGLAAPSSGATECVLFRTKIPAGGALPRHQHDHQDVFTVASGSGTMNIGDETSDVQAGDVVIVPTGEWHFLEAGRDGCEIVVTMLSGTRFIREDGSDSVPPWGL